MELVSFVFSIKTGISPALWSVLRARATLTHANDLLVIWAIVHEYLSRIFILSGGCQRMPLVLCIFRNAHIHSTQWSS